MLAFCLALLCFFSHLQRGKNDVGTALENRVLLPPQCAEEWLHSFVHCWWKGHQGTRVLLRREEMSESPHVSSVTARYIYPVQPERTVWDGRSSQRNRTGKVETHDLKYCEFSKHMKWFKTFSDHLQPAAHHTTAITHSIMAPYLLAEK